MDVKQSEWSKTAKDFPRYKNNYMIKMTHKYKVKAQFAFQKPTNLKGIYCYSTFRHVWVTANRALTGLEQQLHHLMADVAD